MEGDDDGVETRGRRGTKKEWEGKTDEAVAAYASWVPAGFGIQYFHICNRASIEKYNLRHAFHVGLLWSLSGFWQQKWSRRTEGKEAAEEGIRSCFDNFSPSLFSNPTVTTKFTPPPSQPVICQDAFALWLLPLHKPLQSICQVTLHVQKKTGVISSQGSTGSATRDMEYLPCEALTLFHTCHNYFFPAAWKGRLTGVNPLETCLLFVHLHLKETSTVTPAFILLGQFIKKSPVGSKINIYSTVPIQSKGYNFGYCPKHTDAHKQTKVLCQLLVIYHHFIARAPGVQSYYSKSNGGNCESHYTNNF